MNAQTLEALRGSIAKWEAIVAGTGKDLGSNNCPLCQLFRRSNPDDDLCVGCPVALTVGDDDCQGTPYESWCSITWNADNFRTVYDDESRRRAQAELDFLHSLLPEEKAKRDEH